MIDIIITKHESSESYNYILHFSKENFKDWPIKENKQEINIDDMAIIEPKEKPSKLDDARSCVYCHYKAREYRSDEEVISMYNFNFQKKLYEEAIEELQKEISKLKQYNENLLADKLGLQKDKKQLKKQLHKKDEEIERLNDLIIEWKDN